MQAVVTSQNTDLWQNLICKLGVSRSIKRCGRGSNCERSTTRPGNNNVCLPTTEYLFKKSILIKPLALPEGKRIDRVTFEVVCQVKAGGPPVKEKSGA